MTDLKRLQQLTRYLTGSGFSIEQQLDHTTSILEETEQHRSSLVDAARAGGMPWSQIGAAMGLTKQAAQQRYGTKPAPRPDPRQPMLPGVSSGDEPATR